MYQSELCALLAHWNSLGGGDSLPTRQSLKLTEIKTSLPWMFILEMGEDGSLNFKLAGSHFEGFVGESLNDKMMMDLFSYEHDQSAVSELIATSLVKGAGLYLEAKIVGGLSEPQTLRMLCLPFEKTDVMGAVQIVCVVNPLRHKVALRQSLLGGFSLQPMSVYSIPSPNSVTPTELTESTLLYMARAGMNLCEISVSELQKQLFEIGEFDDKMISDKSLLDQDFKL